MKKQRILALIVVFMLLLTSAAYGAIPDNSVIIGDKAYSIDYLMDEGNLAEINGAVANNGLNPIYFQLTGVAEIFTNVMTGIAATSAELYDLPAITYKDATGQISHYAAHNGDLINEEPPAALSLSVSDDAVLNGENNNELFFYLSTDLDVEYIPLYEQSVVVAEMYDDGNYYLHGDDMAGDGIYSAVYEITPSSVDMTLEFTARHNDEHSNTVEVNIYTPISEETLDTMGTVDTSVGNVLASETFDNATEEERKQLIEGELNALSETGMIAADSILYIEEAGIISFQYAGGLLGGVMMRDFDEDFDGNVPYATDTNALQSPLSDEEKQQLWAERKEAGDNSSNPIRPMSVGSEGDKLGSAIILNAFPAFESDPANIAFRTDFYVDLKTEWDGKGLQTTLDTDVTVDDFKNLDSNYDIICVSTHGSTYEWRDGFLWLNQHRYPAICLAENSTKALDKKYSVELKDKQIVKVATSTGTCYWILPALIEKAYASSELDDSFVFVQCCQSKGKDGNVDNSMSDAFESSSVEAYVGYHNSVYSVYGREFMKTYVDQLIENETAQAAFDAAVLAHGANHRVWFENQGGTYDNNVPVAYPILSGSTTATLFQTGIQNGDFSSMTDILFGYPLSWNREGDVRSISQLGEIKTQGLLNLRMAIITTGIGAKTTAAIGNGTEGSIMSQTFVVPADASTISFEYNFVSEEPMEYVGSEFDDSFVVQLKQGNSVVFDQNYESINTSEWIEAAGIDFAGGDDTVFQTGWKSGTIDVTGYRGKLVNLSFIVYDVGDSIYDSACLVDNVVME